MSEDFGNAGCKMLIVSEIFSGKDFFEDCHITYNRYVM